jgi:hypothetical protein
MSMGDNLTPHTLLTFFAHNVNKNVTDAVVLALGRHLCDDISFM